VHLWISSCLFLWRISIMLLYLWLLCHSWNKTMQLVRMILLLLPCVSE
jgi:hypothetical protein